MSEQLEQVQQEQNSIVNNKHDFKLQFDLQSEKQAVQLCKIMLVDEEVSSEQVQRNMKSEGKTVFLEFQSKEPKKIRVAISSFIENMNLVLKTMQAFPPSQ